MAERADAVALRQVNARQGRPTLRVEDVHVTYRVYEDHKPTLRKLVVQRFQRRAYREVLAVRGVTFTGYAGESIGLIGRNGSGKSTLLKAVAGLMSTTKGVVSAHGEPTLLGVNAALNAALSGRRNILLGGLAIGMSRSEIERRADDIIDFAGIRDHIDMPMRTYSSGMRARLQFSIASAVMPEVLLIDETLAVGDADFQKRSSQRVRELREHAGTVIVVSHSMSVIREMSTRVMWLEAGRIVADGAPNQVIPAYEASFRKGR